MNRFGRHFSQRWIAGSSAAFATLITSEQTLALYRPEFLNSSAVRPATPGKFCFVYDGVLGTSLDLCVAAPKERDARECERQILAEIDRLEKILSTYNPESEISRVKAGASRESVELSEVLRAYDLWSARTGGVLNSNLSAVVSLWKEAQKTGRQPTASALEIAIAKPLALNVDALGKGYIVDRSVDVARRFVPAGMLNIGGDIRVWGDLAWTVGIANPRQSSDNAAPLLQFPLREAAVATSAGYARYYTIASRRYSHLIDPRTLHPIDWDASATVVAPDCLTANALSTAAAIMGSDDGANLARIYGSDHLIFGGTGSPPMISSFAPIASSISRNNDVRNGSTAISTTNDTWPLHFQVAINVVLKTPDGSRTRRPYVAVWVENREKKVVRTLTIWGMRDRYMPELTNWCGATGSDHATFDAVSRGTRSPGAYVVVWDGLDDHLHPVPAGEYKVWIEINREHGHHVVESASLICGAEPASVELRATAESDAAPIEYGPGRG